MEAGKILIVEDELFLRELYIDTLTQEGYQIDWASEGEEALQKILKGGFDLILLDIILPKMNAFQIMESLNNNPAYKGNQTPIVFLTNIDNDGDIKKALSLGGAGYLIKSQITPGDLVREVKVYFTKNSSDNSAGQNPSLGNS